MDTLGDRMKFYESIPSQFLFPLIPAIARLDGRSFHTFTRGLACPYDKRLSDLMVETTKFLVQETDARCGYCQSDEITLAWLATTVKSQIFFNGRVPKMTSILAALASTYFNRRLPTFIPEKANHTPIPVFDARVWNVPTEYEAANCFIWREMDATRNSILMAAQSQFSHRDTLNKNTSILQEMLFQEKGINWNDYPAFFKRGTYVRRRETTTKFTLEELDNLPPKHAARLNPDLVIRRTVVMVEGFPPLTKIANREGVILHGEEPVLR